MFVEIVCPECGKTFIRNSRSLYKLIKNGKTIYYCSYTCWAKNDNRRYDFATGKYYDSRKEGKI